MTHLPFIINNNQVSVISQVISPSVVLEFVEAVEEWNETFETVITHANGKRCGFEISQAQNGIIYITVETGKGITWWFQVDREGSVVQEVVLYLPPVK